MTGQLIYCGEDGHRTVRVARDWDGACASSSSAITCHLSAANTFLFLVFAVLLSTCQKPIKMQSSAAWLDQIEPLETNNGEQVDNCAACIQCANVSYSIKRGLCTDVPSDPTNCGQPFTEYIGHCKLKWTVRQFSISLAAPT